MDKQDCYIRRIILVQGDRWVRKEIKKMKQSVPLEERTVNFMFHIGQVLLYLFFANLLLATTGFLLGFSITPALFPLSLVTAFVLLAIFYDEKLNILFLFEMIASILLIVGCVIVFERIYDFSYDGNAYHKLAAGFLKMGWNPLSQVPDGAYTLSMIGSMDTEMSLLIECYPKATEIFAASIYAITNNIESGKIYTILGIFSAFFLTLKCAKGRRGVGFACVAALSPVAMAQMDTFYLDGFLHICLYLLALMLFVEHSGNTGISGKTSKSLIIASMTVLANIKYTGLFYGGFFCLCYYLYEIMFSAKNKNPVERRAYLLKRTGLYVVTAALSVVWGGASAYIVNVFRHANPFYLLIGEGAIDLLTLNSPFPPNSNRLENLGLSLFSRVGTAFNGTYDKNALKIPFTVDWQAERPMLQYPDIRLSGFGVFFGGMFLISVVILFIHFKNKDNRQKDSLIFLNLVICLALMILIEPSWWARYAPYVWLFFLIGLHYLTKSERKWILWVLLLTAVVNSLCWTLDLKKEYQNSVKAGETLSELARSGITIDFDYTVNGGYYPGMCYNLIDFKVPYEIDLNLEQTVGAIGIYNNMSIYSVNKQES